LLSCPTVAVPCLCLFFLSHAGTPRRHRILNNKQSCKQSQQAILLILLPKSGGFHIYRPHAHSCIHALPLVPSPLTCVQHVIWRAGEECDCDISPRYSRARAGPVVQCVSGQAFQRGPVSVASQAVWSGDYCLQTGCLCVCSYGVLLWSKVCAACVPSLMSHLLERPPKKVATSV
jgi:hypothetical protein